MLSWRLEGLEARRRAAHERRAVRVQAESAQPLRFFALASLDQHPGQLLGGVLVADGDPIAQTVQRGQLLGGVRVAGVGPVAQLVQVAAEEQKPGQHRGGTPVAGERSCPCTPPKLSEPPPNLTMKPELRPFICTGLRTASP